MRSLLRVWEFLRGKRKIPSPSCEEKRIRPTTSTTAGDSFPRLGIAVRHRKKRGNWCVGREAVHKTGSPVLPQRRDGNKSCWSTPASTPRRRRDGAKKGTPPGQQHILKHTLLTRVCNSNSLTHTLRLTAPIYSNFEGGRRAWCYVHDRRGGGKGSLSHLLWWGGGRGIYTLPLLAIWCPNAAYGAQMLFLTDGGGGVAYSLVIFPFMYCTEHECHSLKSDFFLF